MSRVGARREREGTIPRATVVPRLAKPARHAGYAPGAHRSIGGCRRSGEAPAFGVLDRHRHRGVGGAGRTSSVAPAFAGRDMRRTRVTERSTLASGPDPRCISGRPPSVLVVSDMLPPPTTSPRGAVEAWGLTPPRRASRVTRKADGSPT